jgi:hypothetical protein
VHRSRDAFAVDPIAIVETTAARDCPNIDSTLLPASVLIKISWTFNRAISCTLVPIRSLSDEVIELILNACFYRRSEGNLAEHVIQPVDYFDFGPEVKKVPLDVPVPDYLDPRVKGIIIGGSGIFGVKTWLRLREIVDQVGPHVPVVVWGMGINDHHRLDRRYHETLAYLESRPNVLLGLRDAFYRNYVPCASCMRAELDAKFAVQHEIGFYVHRNHVMAGWDKNGYTYPTMSNQVRGDPLTYFWNVLMFLGSCDVVITNAYHGAYWATLLKKRVIVVSPFSNKFLGFQNEPIIVDNVNLALKSVELATSYVNALKESRALNIEFYRRVLAFKSSLETRVHAG